MGDSPPGEAIKFATFGRRKVAPRVCIADGKRHIRKFLEDALEELGFITRECTQVGELSAVLDGHAPDLVIVGLSPGGIDAAGMLEALGTPFDSRSLGNSVATLLPAEALPSPVIEAAEALSGGWVELWYQP